MLFKQTHTSSVFADSNNNTIEQRTGIKQPSSPYQMIVGQQTVSKVSFLEKEQDSSPCNSVVPTLCMRFAFSLAIFFVAAAAAAMSPCSIEARVMTKESKDSTLAGKKYPEGGTVLGFPKYPFICHTDLSRGTLGGGAGFFPLRFSSFNSGMRSAFSLAIFFVAAAAAAMSPCSIEAQVMTKESKDSTLAGKKYLEGGTVLGFPKYPTDLSRGTLGGGGGGGGVGAGIKSKARGGRIVGERKGEARGRKEGGAR
ncbi:hypothetical protein Tco_1188872 [Tanacetum coccineum]